jgi:Bacteriocin-protection, YdeI or OmpD-Associated
MTIDTPSRSRLDNPPASGRTLIENGGMSSRRQTCSWPPALQRHTNNTYAAKPAIPDLPNYIAEVFQEDSKAWKFFRELAPSYRRYFVAWIHTAKRPETREKRIRESIRLLAAGKKLGLK